MTSKAIVSLLQRRDALLKQISVINSQVLQQMLDSGTAASAPGMPAGRGARGRALAARGGTRRKWFERGEMIKLTRKILTQPMTQADLVRALAGAKGYDKGLPATEKARFKSAAYQAIAAALNGKQLFRNKQGQVATRRG
jgi:hypothetical protein